MRVSLAALGQQTSPLVAQAGCAPVMGICPAGQVNATDPITGCPTSACVGGAGNPAALFLPSTPAATNYTPYILAALAVGVFVWMRQR